LLVQRLQLRRGSLGRDVSVEREPSADGNHLLKVQIFKGATRPAMMAGVPFMPFFLNVFVHALALIWTLALGQFWLVLFVLFSGGTCYLLMRVASEKDDQRLLQWLLLFQLRIRQSNRGFWSVNSYAPIPPRRQSRRTSR
jgi:type IV secretion system protein VirB3